MAKTATTTPSRRARESRTEDGLTLVVDVDKAIGGVKTVVKEGAAHIRALLKEKGVKLSKDEDDDLDKKLGVVDGGAIDNAVDKATGVDEATDPEDPEDKPASERRKKEDDTEEDDVDDAAVAAMDAKGKAAFKKSETKRKEAEKRAVEAEARADRATGALKTGKRTSLAEHVMEDLKIPDDYRPRLRYELTEHEWTEAQMREHAKAFDLSFIRTRESGGVPLHARASGTSGVPKFDFSKTED